MGEVSRGGGYSRGGLLAGLGGEAEEGESTSSRQGEAAVSREEEGGEGR